MRLARWAAGALAVWAVLSSSGEARADGPTFGRAGELGVSWDQPLVATTFAGELGTVQPMALTPIGFQYFTASNNGGSGTTFEIAPAADYFVIDNLSIGAQVLFGIVSYSPPSGPMGQSPSSTTTLYGIAPQVGYNLALGDSVSFWPKVFFGFVASSQSNNGPSTNSGTLGVYAPFLFHIASHFYAGAGPDFSTQLFVNQSQNGQSASNPSKVTTIGAMATFGGWFNLGGG